MVSRILPDNGGASNPPPFGNDMAELSLLVPSWQARALEECAHAHGLTTAQILRRLIGDFCSSDIPEIGGRFVRSLTK